MPSFFSSRLAQEDYLYFWSVKTVKSHSLKKLDFAKWNIMNHFTFIDKFRKTTWLILSHCRHCIILNFKNFEKLLNGKNTYVFMKVLWNLGPLVRLLLTTQAFGLMPNITFLSLIFHMLDKNDIWSYSY